MFNKSMKRVLALTLAATMVFSSAMVVFAEDTAQEASGSATFEGVEPDYPAVTTVTLPTAASAAGFFNYTADPAGLMRKYGGSELTAKLPETAADTGIYFATADSKYAPNSQELTVENQNALDINVNVSVEVTSASYDDMTFATSGTWESSDTDNEIYLAVVEKDASPANTAVLSAAQAANLTIAIPGTKSNYSVKRTVDSGTGKASYAYALNEGTLTWESKKFYLTGAINKNATWSDGTVTAPNIKVTWDWSDPNAAPTTYTVTFHKNTSAEDTTTTTAQVATGTAPASDVATAWTNDGFRLAGWATEATGTPAALSTYTSISEATDLFAIWEEKIYVASNTISTTSNSIGLELPDGVTFSSALVTNGESSVDLVENTHYVLTNGTTFGVAKSYLTNWGNAGYNTIVITFSDGVTNNVTIQ